MFGVATFVGVTGKEGRDNWALIAIFCGASTGRFSVLDISNGVEAPQSIEGRRSYRPVNENPFLRDLPIRQ